MDTMLRCAITIYIALWCILTPPTNGAKLLMVPINVNSHVQFMSRLGVALAEEGHMTTLVVPESAKIPDWARDSKMEVWTYQGAGTEPYANSEQNSRQMIGAALADSMMERMNLLMNATMTMMHDWEADCVRMMESHIPAKVKAAQFDLAIMDVSGLTCNYALPYSLDIPFASFSIYSSPWIFRVPGLPSFVPNMITVTTDRMTFKDRLMTTLTEAMGVMMANHTGTMIYTAKYAPHREKLDMFSMAKQAVFYFYLDDIAIGYPKPLMPNTANIGDIMTSPAKPLPEGDLRKFVESSPQGVVVVSFGSYLDHLPDDILKKLCDGFKMIPQRVVWKLKRPEMCEDSDVFLLKWLPQNDLLGHEKVVAFVTHAGLNSLIESVYHGVPVVTVPISLDQPFNSKFMTSRGIAEEVNIREFTSAELASKIQNVINGPDVSKNIKMSSAVLREKPQSAGKRASFWVNHILKYGSNHLRSGAFELNIFQFYMVDIFLFLFITVIAIIAILISCLYCSYKGVKRFCCKSKTQAKKLKVN